MKRTILIVVVVLVIVGVGVAFWFINNGMNTSGGSGVGQLPPAQTSTPSTVPSSTVVSQTPPTGDTIVIGTSEGSVTMNNFYKNAAIVSPGEGALITHKPSYDISYNALDSSFSISLLDTPIMTVREQASQAFIQALGVSEQDACKLKVTVETPVAVDPQDAGIDMGLSFCNVSFQAQ